MFSYQIMKPKAADKNRWIWRVVAGNGGDFCIIREKKAKDHKHWPTGCPVAQLLACSLLWFLPMSGHGLGASANQALFQKHYMGKTVAYLSCTSSFLYSLLVLSQQHLYSNMILMPLPGACNKYSLSCNKNILNSKKMHWIPQNSVLSSPAHHKRMLVRPKAQHCAVWRWLDSARSRQ